MPAAGRTSSESHALSAGSSSTNAAERDKFKKMTPRSRTLSVIIADKAQTVSKMASFVDLAMDDDDLQQGEPNVRGTVVVVDSSSEATGTEILERAVSDDQNGMVQVADSIGHVAGMDSTTLMRVALEDEWQMVSCASLPFTILFFLVFMFFFQTHYGITDLFLVERPIRTRLQDPAVDNVQSLVDIYSWLETSYLPYLWGAKAENFIDDRLNTPALFQNVVGGTRFTISFAKRAPCEDVKDLDCHSGEIDVEKGGAFSRRLSWNTSLQTARPLALPEINSSSMAPHGKKSEGAAIGERPISARWASWKAKKRVAGRAASSGYKHRLEDKSHQAPRRVNGVFAEGISRPSRARLPRRSLDYEARRLRLNRPEIRSDIPKIAQPGNKSEVVLPISWDLKDAIAEVHRWKANLVIDGTMKAFKAEVLLLNNRIGKDRELLSSVVIEFGIERGGEVFVDFVMITLVLTPVANDGLQAFLAVMWVLGLITFSVMLFSRAYVRYMQGRLRHHLKRFWNWIEWFIIGWGWFSLCLFAVERSLVWGVKKEIDDYTDSRKSIPPWDRYVSDIDAVKQILEKTATAAMMSMWVQLVVALFHIVIALRFFLASRGQPRLAIVLNTIRKAASDLLHLLIVFMIIFIGYAVSGNFLFGRRMHEFATFSGSFARCFQIVMEREYPWARFTEEDQWTATLWVWTFLVLIVLVLVNIFLAMLFDTYGDVRSSVGNSATLWQTTKIVLAHSRRLCRCMRPIQYGHKWVPNREIIQAVKMMQSDVVTPWMILDCFPGISNRQVNYLFNLAKIRFETMLIRTSSSSLPAIVASMLLGVERMYEKLSVVLSLQEDHSSEHSSDAPKKETTVSDLASFGESETKRSKKKKMTDLPKKAKVIAPVEKPPTWQKIQLMPHIKKQQIILTQVQTQVRRIRQAMHLRGYVDENVPPAPMAEPGLLLRVGAIDHHHNYPLGPSSASLHVVPAVARSGMTQSALSLPPTDGIADEELLKLIRN